MNRFENYLKEGDLRSISQSNTVVDLVKNQDDFDELFRNLYNGDRKIMMRTADAVEKIMLKHPHYLENYSNEIIRFCKNSMNIEFKWHLAILVSRIKLSESDLVNVFQLLKTRALDKQESKIVRVNSLQSLYHLKGNKPEFLKEYEEIVQIVSAENIPSINARIKKLREK